MATDVAAEKALEAWVGVERTLRFGDLDSVDGRQHGEHVLAAAIERLAHFDYCIERTSDSSERCTLGDVVHVAGVVALQVGASLDYVGGCDHPSDSPAGHGVRLGNTVQDDALVGELRNDNGHRVMFVVAVDEVLVDLVGDDPKVVLDGPLADGFDLVAAIHRPGWVGWRNEQDRFGLVGAGSFELVDGCPETRLDVGEYGHMACAGEGDGLGVGGPVRGWDNDLVTRVEDDGKRASDGLLAAVGDEHVGGLALEARVADGLGRYGFAQVGKAARWRVLVVGRVGARL